MSPHITVARSQNPNHYGHCSLCVGTLGKDPDGPALTYDHDEVVVITLGRWNNGTRIVLCERHIRELIETVWGAFKEKVLPTGYQGGMMRRYDRQYLLELVKYGSAMFLFCAGVVLLLIVYGPSYE